MATPTTEDFPSRLKRLAQERDFSLNQVGYLAWNRKVPGTGPDMLKKARSGKSRPGVRLIEAVAAVLEVDPREFPEYRLALLRRSLDENEVGLDAAVAEAAKIEAALAIAPAADGPQAPGGALARDLQAAPTSQRSPKRTQHRGVADGSAGSGA